MPLLRERRDDLPRLTDHFLAEFSREYGHRLKRLDVGALTVLRSHNWPGNVCELRNVLERLAIMVPGESIGVDDLGFLSGGGSVNQESMSEGQKLPLQAARERFERDYIVRALPRSGETSHVPRKRWG